ncbi:MAG: hypothetical protein WA869_20180 [Alloacidobacterium sp.]
MKVEELLARSAAGWTVVVALLLMGQVLLALCKGRANPEGLKTVCGMRTLNTF